MRAFVVGLALTSLVPDSFASPARDEVDKAVAAAPPHRLRKRELRPTMKKLMPRVHGCYVRELDRDPRSAGVINVQLTIRNAPGLGLTLAVGGFETHGKLGESKPFLACVTRTLEAGVFTPIATLGRADVIYPLTFATTPPSARDQAVVERSERAAAANDWTTALASAARGLELASLDGPSRRHLIELAGLAACHLRDEPTARHYYALASPEFEAELETACAAESIALE